MVQVAALALLFAASDSLRVGVEAKTKTFCKSVYYNRVSIKV